MPSCTRRRQGRRLGFDGKSLIHPNQIEPAHRAFAPSACGNGPGTALVDAYKGGAERFGDEMIERMHVEAAQRVPARAVSLTGPWQIARRLSWADMAQLTDTAGIPLGLTFDDVLLQPLESLGASEPGGHPDLPHPRNPAQHPDPVVGDGHGDRSGHGDRAWPSSAGSASFTATSASRSRRSPSARSNASKAAWWSTRSP